MRGFRGLSPKQLERAMRQLGISVEELENVEEVIIKTASKEYLFKKPSVTVMLAQGQKTYQVIGEVEVRDRITGRVEEAPFEAPVGPLPIEIPKSDIELVAQQANVSFEDAKKALEETKGNIAEAILKLQSEKRE
ncbi:MAG: nascent polypeptide-associated complex protein [Candidatus Thermoplasmatota archaeon]